MTTVVRTKEPAAPHEAASAATRATLPERLLNQAPYQVGWAATDGKGRGFLPGPSTVAEARRHARSASYLLWHLSQTPRLS